MNIISALMIRYEEIGKTQWFLTSTTCDKDSFSTLTKTVLMIVHNVLKESLSHVVGVKNNYVFPISSYEYFFLKKKSLRFKTKILKGIH
jgi:hypothetical protein